MRAFSTSYGIRAAVVVAAFAASTACLRKDVTHTIYVSPSGVTWSAFEKDVRSDETDPFKRQLEEQDFILAARGGRHGIAQALRRLGAGRLDTTILRRDRPFTVVTDGEFTDLAALSVAMIRTARLRGDATIDRDGCELTYRAWVDVEAGAAGDSNDLDALVADTTSYRLVLTAGRFLRADGFTIEGDGAVALPTVADPAEDGIARVSLSWREGWCAGL